MVIYKIVNDINNKIYIGKTNSFLNRYKQHFSQNNLKREPNKILYLAMHKYGFEHFTMSIVEECNEQNWEEREQYWINYYNTLIPNGYNMIPGGSEPPHEYGENSSNAKLTQKEVDEIIILLQTNNFEEMSNLAIAAKYNISVYQIRRINNGEAWYKVGIHYPIRCSDLRNDLEEIYNLLESWEYTCEEIGKMYGKSKSCIKAINSGHNFFDPNRVYPIKPPKIFYSKQVFLRAKELLSQHICDAEIVRQTGMKNRTLTNLKNGQYDKYLNL